MKRALYFTACGLMAVALAGCNRGWPNLFCLNNLCQPPVYEECDPCTTSYAPIGPGEWIVGPSNAVVDPLPGPAATRPARD